MKRKIIFSTILCMLISTAVCAEGNTAVIFDRSDKTVCIDGSVGNSAGVLVTVSIAKNSDGEIGEDNLPMYMYLHETGDGGTLSITIPTAADTGSGKYDLYLDSMSGHEKYSFMLVNTDDSKTLAVVDAINKASSQSEVYSILKRDGDKLGLDTEDELIINAMDDIAKLCYNGKGNYTADTLCDMIDEALRAVETEHSVIVSIIQAETWSHIEDIVLKNADVIGIDISAGSEYSKIAAANRYKIFTAMMNDRSRYSTYSDVRESFNKAVESAKSTTGASKGNGGSGGGGSSSGGGGGSVPSSGMVLPASGKDTESRPMQTPQPVQPEVKNDPVLFSDISVHWGREYIEKLAAKGVISGYADNTFRPDNSVTRAEYVKMVTALFDISGSAAEKFDDVNDTDWFYESVESAVSAGIVNGIGGSFMPHASITRQDAAVILYRLGSRLKPERGAAFVFTDEADISNYAKTAVGELSSAGIINGDGGMFHPLSPITRAEAAAILCRAYGI